MAIVSAAKKVVGGVIDAGQNLLGLKGPGGGGGGGGDLAGLLGTGKGAEAFLKEMQQQHEERIERTRDLARSDSSEGTKGSDDADDVDVKVSVKGGGDADVDVKVETSPPPRGDLEFS